MHAHVSLAPHPTVVRRRALHVTVIAHSQTVISHTPLCADVWQGKLAGRRPLTHIHAGACFCCLAKKPDISPEAVVTCILSLTCGGVGSTAVPPVNIMLLLVKDKKLATAWS